MLDLEHLLADAPGREAIRCTGEIDRILSLPARPEADPALVQGLSRAFSSTGTLRDEQAVLLREVAAMRGAFAPMRVGSGKTLPTFLIPLILQSRRPVLVLPAKLKAKTKSDYARYAREWSIKMPEIVSSSIISHPNHEQWLFENQPDLLMMDEAQFVRDRSTTTTMRIEAYIEACRTYERQRGLPFGSRLVVVALSGTLITESLLDYYHIVRWCLGDAAPVPPSEAEAERWSLALDRDVPLLDRIQLGELSRFPGGFHEFFRGRRGIVPTSGAGCSASISIARWRPTLPDVLREAVRFVETTGFRPDGEALEDLEIPEVIQQLCMGFYYVWDPLPPDWWLKPRRAWNFYVRSVLEKRMPGLDSMKLIRDAVDGMRQPPPDHAEGVRLLERWREVKDQFTPNSVPVWLSYEMVGKAIKQARDGCLIWVAHTAVGEAFEAMGVPYYRGGQNPEQAPPGRTIAVSMDAHTEGKNLQAWHRGLWTALYANPNLWEQGIGRMHRPDQHADNVHVDMIEVSDYHRRTIDKVRKKAAHVGRASGFEQKLELADWV